MEKKKTFCTHIVETSAAAFTLTVVPATQSSGVVITRHVMKILIMVVIMIMAGDIWKDNGLN